MMRISSISGYRTLLGVMRLVPIPNEGQGLLLLCNPTQQVHRIQRTFRRLLVLEVGKHVMPRGHVLANSRNHIAPLFVRVTWLAESVINKRSSDDIRRGAILGLGYTESGSVRLERIPSRIGKPGFVTKFKSCRQRARQKREKIFE